MAYMDRLRLFAEDAQIAARIDHPGFGSRQAKRLDRAIDGVAFGDAVEADDELPAQPDSAIVDQIEVGGRTVFSGGRRAIEQAASGGVNLLRAFENLPGPVVDGDERPRRRAVKARDVAVGYLAAHQAMHALDCGECPVESGRRACEIRHANLDQRAEHRPRPPSVP
jgi:hypothetical protein